jgi:hypothetical protein
MPLCVFYKTSKNRSFYIETFDLEMSFDPGDPGAISTLSAFNIDLFSQKIK